MDKSSRTLLLLLVSSSVVLIIFIICIGSIYISKQHQLHIIWLYSSSHPLLVLNLIILLIIASSRFFAISRHIDNQDDLDQLMLPRETIIPSNPNSQAAEGIAEAPMSKTLESTWKTTKEGSHLRQLKHSHNVKPPEMLTDQRNDEVTSSASSSLSSAKLRKHVSLSKEEVNRRVERFIRKFNDD